MRGHAIDKRSDPQAATSGAVVLAVGRLVAARPAAVATTSDRAEAPSPKNRPSPCTASPPFEPTTTSRQE
jgi:hypothetical protein